MLINFIELLLFDSHFMMHIIIFCRLTDEYSVPVQLPALQSHAIDYAISHFHPFARRMSG